LYRLKPEEILVEDRSDRRQVLETIRRSYLPYEICYTVMMVFCLVGAAISYRHMDDVPETTITWIFCYSVVMAIYFGLSLVATSCVNYSLQEKITNFVTALANMASLTTVGAQVDSMIQNGTTKVQLLFFSLNLLFLAVVLTFEGPAKEILVLMQPAHLPVQGDNNQVIAPVQPVQPVQPLRGDNNQVPVLPPVQGANNQVFPLVQRANNQVPPPVQGANNQVLLPVQGANNQVLLPVQGGNIQLSQPLLYYSILMPE